MKSTIELTASARREVERAGIGKRIAALTFDAGMMKGDFVDVATETGVVGFVIRSRRLVISDDDSPFMVFELDYPARPPMHR